MLHSPGNKLTGLALYFGGLVAFLYGTLPMVVWILIFGMALISSVEEMVIILRDQKFNPTQEDSLESQESKSRATTWENE